MLILAAVLAAHVLAGCASPFRRDPELIAIRQQIQRSMDEELAELPATEEPLAPATTSSPVEEALAPWREELERVGPQLGDAYEVGNLGPDLAGSTQGSVSISLAEAVNAALRHNLPTKIARLQPAISESDVTAAHAAFDAVWFTNADFNRVDEPQTVPVLQGVLLGAPARARDSARFETGFRKTFTSGAEVSASTDFVYTDERTPFIRFFPDPSYTSAVRLRVTQPLLRGFGTEVNTATIHLNRNTQRRSVQDLELNLMRLVLDTESAYWDLVLAWQSHAIRQWLTEAGAQVRDTLERRRDLDAKLAEYSDAVAVTEQRRADVIRARRQVRAASDRLKQLMNDPRLAVASEVALWPTDPAADAPIAYDLSEAVRTAVANRPEVHGAALNIDDAAVRQMLADNARLPSLALAAEMDFFGLDRSLGDAYDRLSDGGFIDYAVGLALEVPLGNRAAEANYRKARLQRSAAMLAYRQAVQDAVARVKSALREVVTNFELVQATRSFRIAQAQNLRTLLQTEENLGSLTPEFLNLKFQRQQTLAQARQEESQARASYSKSVAALYDAMGVALKMKGITMEREDEER